MLLLVLLPVKQTSKVDQLIVSRAASPQKKPASLGGGGCVEIKRKYPAQLSLEMGPGDGCAEFPIPRLV